jgi:pimeloyl-ACP methyl ester carboxylesterase
MSLSKIWEATERAGLGEPISDVYREKLLRVQLHPGNERAGRFDLFYFIHEPKGLSQRLKTVLFCAGGPGQIVRPFEENFLRFLRTENTAYRIVHFHLRGSGFSQFPPSNDFDRFLRTSYAVNDIEEIRKDVLKDEPWDGIVGYSYGTVLAQQYAARYKKKVRKLILMGPLSMHKFKFVTSPAQATQVFDEYMNAEAEIRRQVLMNILTNKKHEEFNTINDDKNVLGDLEIKLSQLFKQIEETFGSEQFIFEQYDVLKKKLRDAHLDHGSNFFKKIRDLRMIGWQNPEIEDVPERQVEAVRVIAVGLKPELKEKLGEVDSGEDSVVNHSDESYRTHYVMQIYDGLRPRFVRALLAGDKQNVRDALKRSAGRVGINRFIEKVGVAKGKPKIWDPAEHKHGVPTLILKGEADPVTAVGQAEYYCEKALTGPRILLKLEGVGHGFHLPVIDIREPFLIGSVRIEPKKINIGQTKEVSGFIYCEARVEGDDPAEDGGPNDGLAPTGHRRKGRHLEFEEAIILSEKKVSVLVRNLSSQRAHTEGISLILRHPLFEGRVVLQSVGIPPKNVSWVKGTLEKSDKKPFVVKRPKDLDRPLIFDSNSAEFKPPDTLTLKIRNDSNEDVTVEARDWIYRPPHGDTEFIGPCQGIELNARNALVYAFLEMEFEDFAEEKVQILGKIKPFLAGLWIHDGDKWKTRWDKDDKKVRRTNFIERPSTSIHAAVGPLS